MEVFKMFFHKFFCNRNGCLDVAVATMENTSDRSSSPYSTDEHSVDDKSIITLRFITSSKVCKLTMKVVWELIDSVDTFDGSFSYAICFLSHLLFELVRSQ